MSEIKWRPTAFTADDGEYSVTVVGDIDGDIDIAHAAWSVFYRGHLISEGRVATLEEAQAKAIAMLQAVKSK